MIFKTFDNDIDKWTAKIGIFGKSFNELGNAVNDAFKSVIDNLDNFDEDVGFWESLKNNLFSKDDNDKDWIKNSLGEIISQENIDSYIKELDLSSAKNKSKEIFDWQENVANGDTTWEKFFDTCKGGNEYIVDLIKNTDDLSKLTGEDLVNACNEARKSAIAHNKELENMSFSAKAATAATKALSIAGNMLLMWGVSEVISGLYSLSQVSRKVAEKAQELGESFINSKSEIDDYKTQITELYDTINNGTSSIEDVTIARQNLMTIQNELIKKFGDEKGAIDLITDAANGQTNAFDKLSKKQWKETLNEFNDTDFGDKVANWWDGYSTNVDRMLDKYQDYTINIDYGSLVSNWKSNKAKEIFNLLESGGAEISHIKETGVPVVKLSGTADEIHQKLLNIQEIFSDENALSTENFRQHLTALANSAKDTTDKYKNFYDQYILYEKVLSNSGAQKGYDKSFEKINNAMQSYNDAKLTGDENRIQQAGEKYASILSDELSKVPPQDEDVYNYLKKLYPEMQEIVGSWNLEYDLKSSEESKKELKDAFGKFNGTNEIKNYYRSTGQDKNKNQAYDSLMKYADKYGLTLDQLIERGYELAYVQDENYNELVKRFGKENVETLNDKSLEAAYKIPDVTLLSWDELKQKIAEVKNAANEANTSKPKSFRSLWDSIGTTGDDDTKKAAQEEKEKLIELAEAGKLTEKALSDSSIADTFTDAGYSIEETTEKINKFVENTKRLSTMRTGITAITSAYDEKKDSKNKTVSASTLESMSDTLGVSEWAKKDQKVWENYKSTASDGSKSLSELKDAQDALATSYVNSNNFLANLDDTNKGYYQSLLTEMGVTNAESIITQTLADKYAVLAAQKQLVQKHGEDLEGATLNEINTLADEANMSDTARFALIDLALEKQGLNDVCLDTTKDVDALIDLGAKASVAASELAVLQQYKSAKEKGYMPSSDLKKLKESAEKAGQSVIDSYKDKVKSSTSVSTSKGNKTNGSSSSKDKGSSKESKQTFDWIERRLKNLQNVIDFTASKLQNLFSVKAKNKNLDKQIKTTTKLISAYGTAANKYQQKADKIAGGSTKTVKGKNGKKKKVKTKGLSKNIIQKIKTGKLTKKSKLSSLIAEYGQSTAEKIQSYIDYYDKAQDAKKNKQDQIAKKRELEQQKNQNYVDLYDSRTARAEAKESIAIGADNKNKSVDTQIKNTKLSYQYQIKIANLNKDKAKAQQLEYEREKKIVELQKQKIENIKTEYDNRIALLESGEGDSLSGKKDLQNQVALLEAKGQIVTAGYYSAQNKIENEKLNLQKEELAKLISKQSTFAKGSDEWYELQSDIQSTQDAINESQIAIVENTTAIRELHTTMLEEIAENANRLNSEADFLATLLSRDELTDSDTGTFTNAGIATLGAYGINMETAQSQIRELDKERAILEQMKKTGSLDYGDNGKHKYDSLNQLEEAYNNIIEKQKEWTQNEFDAEQKIIDLMKERYQAQLDYMKEIIDAKRTALDLEKDLFEYSKNIANQTKNIATLEKRLTALKGDTSEEGRARMTQIQLSLDEANQDLQDTEYDRYISDQQNMLDNMYTEYEDLMNHLFKDTDKLLQEGIQAINSNGGFIKSILDKKAEDYGYDYSSNFSSIMGAFTESDTIVTGIRDSISSEDESSISKKLDTINTTIKEKYDPPNTNPPKTGGTGGAGSGGNNGGDSSYTGSTMTVNSGTPYENVIKVPDCSFQETMNKINPYLNSNVSNPKTALNKLIKKKSDFVISSKNNHQDFKDLAKALGVSQKVDYSANGAVYKYLKSHGFRTGGIGKLVKASGEDGFALVRNGEGFVSPEHVESIKELMNIIPDMTKFTSSLTYIKPVNRELGNQTFGDINLQLDLPNVENAHDLVSELQTNNSRTQKAFIIAVKDLVAKGKITNNIQSIR